MSNLPLQSRPPKYPLGHKGLFGGMVMPGATGQALHPPITPTGGTTLPGQAPAPKPVMPHPAEMQQVHALPGGSLSSAPHIPTQPVHPAEMQQVYHGPNGSMTSAPPVMKIPQDFTTRPGIASPHPAAAPSQLTDFTTRMKPGAVSPANFNGQFQSQGSLSSLAGRPPVFASEQSYSPPQNPMLPPSPTLPSPRLSGVVEQPLQYKGKFAAHAQTPVSQWTPEMHKDFNASLSPDTQLSMLNNQVRSESRTRDTNRKLGIGGFGGMVDGTEASNAAKAHQKELINPLLVENRNQETERWMSPSDAKQKRLGGAKPVEQAPTPSLDETSPFWAGEGKTKQLPGKFGSKEPGTTVVSRTSSIDGKPSRGSELIGSGAMAKLNAAGITAQDLASRKPGDKTDMAFKQLQRELSTQRAEELSAKGGGVSKARQYSDEQKDLRMLSHAQKHGNMGLKTVQAAAVRQGDREDKRSVDKDFSGMIAPGASRNASIVSADKYANTPAGKAFSNDVKNGIGVFGGGAEESIHNAINKHMALMKTPEDRAAFQNYIQNHVMPASKLKLGKSSKLAKTLDAMNSQGKPVTGVDKSPQAAAAEPEASGLTPSSITDMSGSTKGYSFSPSDWLAGNENRTPWDRVTMQNAEGLSPAMKFADMGLEGLRHLSGLSAYQSLPGWYKWATTPQKKQ